MGTNHTVITPNATPRSLASYLPLSGGTMTGNLLSSGQVQGVTLRGNALNSYDNGFSIVVVNSGTGKVGLYGSGDEVLHLTSAKIEQRNGTTSQTFDTFRTYTDASNYQGFRISHSAGLTTLSAITAGTGADNVGITLAPAGTGKVAIESPLTLKGYTVATLPAGTQGDTAFVTDALAPAFLAAVIGGGAVVTTVFYDGANWIVQ